MEKHVSVMDICLVVVCVIMLAFTTVMIWIFCRYGAVPDTLVVSVYGVLGGECGFLAMIRTAKERNRDRKNELEDRAYAERYEERIREEKNDNAEREQQENMGVFQEGGMLEGGDGWPDGEPLGGIVSEVEQPTGRE